MENKKDEKLLEILEELEQIQFDQEPNIEDDRPDN